MFEFSTTLSRLAGVLDSLSTASRSSSRRAAARLRRKPGVECLEDRWAPSATTTTLTAVPNATTGGELVTFTATVDPSPDASGTVTFRDNGAVIPGGADVDLFDGIAIFATPSLSVGTHPVTAAYSGAPGFDASVSTPINVSIAEPPAAPQVVSIVPNAGIAGYEGPQRSRILNVQYKFDQPVGLDTDAITVAIHSSGVTFRGVAQPNGYGTVPKLVITPSADQTTWTVAFGGFSTDIGRFDGLSSLKDGVYDFHVDAAKIHLLSAPSTVMISDSSYTIYRLFGDTDGPVTPNGGVPGVDFAAVVNTGDNLVFRNAFFTNPGHYVAYLDSDGDGSIRTADNFEFRNRFNKVLTWQM
jgi:hypothetical protein